MHMASYLDTTVYQVIDEGEVTDFMKRLGLLVLKSAPQLYKGNKLASRKLVN